MRGKREGRKLTGGGELRETRTSGGDEPVGEGVQNVTSGSESTSNMREHTLVWKECMLLRAPKVDVMMGV